MKCSGTFSDRLLLIDAQKIGVHDEALGRMALKRFDYGFFLSLPMFSRDDMGEEGSFSVACKMSSWAMVSAMGSLLPP